MRKIILLIVMAALVAVAYADIIVGNGRVETESRKVAAFSSISLNGSGTLRVHRGSLKVEITSDSNILPYITATVSGDELRIGVEPFNSIMSATKLQFDVSLPELRGVGVAGSGNVLRRRLQRRGFPGECRGLGRNQGRSRVSDSRIGLYRLRRLRRGRNGRKARPAMHRFRGRLHQRLGRSCGVLDLGLRRARRAGFLCRRG